MTRIALLDVNVLVALFYPDHIHHEAAHGWFSANREDGWATCPLTENGLVRILSNIAYTGIHESTSMIRRRLDSFCSSGNHTFWPDHLSLRDQSRFKLSGVSHAQITKPRASHLESENHRTITAVRRVLILNSAFCVLHSAFFDQREGRVPAACAPVSLPQVRRARRRSLRMTRDFRRRVGGVLPSLWSWRGHRRRDRRGAPSRIETSASDAARLRRARR